MEWNRIEMKGIGSLSTEKRKEKFARQNRVSSVIIGCNAYFSLILTFVRSLLEFVRYYNQGMKAIS